MPQDVSHTELDQIEEFSFSHRTGASGALEIAAPDSDLLVRARFRVVYTPAKVVRNKS
jgi:hypothetical protein